MIIPDSLGFILWNLNLISLIFFFNFKNLWKTNIPLVSRFLFFKAMEVSNLLVLALKLTYVLLASIINSLVHIHLFKMVVLRENIIMWLRLAWPFSSTPTFLLVSGLMLSTLQLISSTNCPLHFLTVSHPLNFYMATLRIMRIFILLVVVFILACVIIWLTNFLPTAFLAFSWVIVPLIKGFVALILPPLGYTSPATLTFLLSLASRPNLFFLFIFQVSWNRVFTILIHPPLPRTFLDPTPLHVMFFLTLWMSLCRLILLLQVLLCHPQLPIRLLLSLLLISLLL